MTRFLLSSVLCVAVASVAAKPTENVKFTQDDLQFEASRHGLVGVASIAGITSRNGRVSSVGGIRFFPGPDSPGYYYPLALSSDNTYPLTVSAERDGKYASGTVQVKPGYISSSARAGFGPKDTASNRGFSSSYAGLPKPFREFFQPQPDLFGPKNVDNWFAKDLFSGFTPSRPDVIRNGWMIPNFNPFMNFWR